MLIYDKNFYNNKLPGGENLIKKLTTPGRLENGNILPYGYGLRIGKLDGRNMISHNGALRGFLSSMMRFPDQNMTVFMTSNIYDTKVYEKAIQTAKIYLGIPLNKSNEVNYDDEIIEDFTSKNDQKLNDNFPKNRYLGKF
jgi:hypothetical protein